MRCFVSTALTNFAKPRPHFAVGRPAPLGRPVQRRVYPCASIEQDVEHANGPALERLQERGSVLEIDNLSIEPPPEGVYYSDDEHLYQPLLSSAVSLAVRNFNVELRALLRELRRAVGVDAAPPYAPPQCLGFRLSKDGIATREREREAEDGAPDVWPPVRLAYEAVCVSLDLLYEGRPIERFWVLETVARLPYLAYTSCLHLLGTLGWYRSTTLMSLHRAEDMNESFHLAVMESLGGDQRWLDRFAAFHISLIYYWILVALFFISPKQSYGFSQLLEAHAVDTYSEFVETNVDVLQTLPVPEVAHEYFSEFLFYYQEIQVREAHDGGKPRPQLNSLYDVFKNILEDEKEHSVAMEACSKYVQTGEPIMYNGREVSSGSRRLELLKGERERFWRKWEQNRRTER